MSQEALIIVVGVSQWVIGFGTALVLCMVRHGERDVHGSRALEARLARAWHEGWTAGYHKVVSHTTNPYRAGESS